MLNKQQIKPSHARVLVVDDDPEIRSIIIEHLRTMGFQKFIEAGDGGEAFKIFLNSVPRIDLILCDWEMPNTNGLAFLRAVRETHVNNQVPFIMITSQQSEERLKIAKAKKYRVSAYIVKPFVSETLKEKVLQVLYSEPENQTGS